VPRVLRSLGLTVGLAFAVQAGTAGLGCISSHGEVPTTHEHHAGHQPEHPAPHAHNPGGCICLSACGTTPTLPQSGVLALAPVVLPAASALPTPAELLALAARPHTLPLAQAPPSHS
jgi:hypothetical protein